MTGHSLAGKRCVTYSRFSTQHQRDESLADQRRVCRAYIEERGGTCTEDYADAARSGTTFSGRAGWASLMQDLEGGKIDVVVCEDLSRITRTSSSSHAIHEELDSFGVELHTVKAGKTSDIQVAFEAVQNSHYVKDARARSRRSVEGTVLSGRQSGRVPYGYKKVPKIKPNGSVESGHREIVPEEANVIIGIYRDFDAGVGALAICRRLTNEGAISPTGMPWRPGVLYGNKHKKTGILRNRVYVSETVWGRSKTRLNIRAEKKRQDVTPAHEWIRVKTPDLQIVPLDLFEAVQQRLDENQHPEFYTRRKNEYLLTGLCYCGACGAKYQVLHVKMGCVARTQRHACDNRRRVYREELEQLVLDSFKTTLLHPRFIKPFVDEYRREYEVARREEGSRRQSLTDRLQSLEAAKRNYLEDLQSAGSDRTVRNLLLAEVSKIENERAGVERELSIKKSEKLVELNSEAIIERMHNLVGDLRNALTSDARDATRAKEVIRDLIESVTITPIEEERADRRGVGPVRVQVKGNLTKALQLAEIDRVVQHSSRTQTTLNHATSYVYVKFNIYPKNLEPREEGYGVIVSTSMNSGQNMKSVMQVLVNGHLILQLPDALVTDLPTHLKP